jgi:hypothetical protein
LVIEKDGVKVEYLGRVYGIIPETNNATFEKKTVNGIEREYLVCEGLLYNKFPESVQIFDRDGVKSQSMELASGTIEGKFDKNGVYEFSKFQFEAACVLGEGVTPAMTGSLIEKFSVSTMQSEITELLAEFNKNFTQFSNELSNKGGENVDEKLELLNKFGELGDEVLEQVKKNLENYSLEVLENHLHLMSEADPRQEEQTEEVEVETPEQFSLTGKQLQKEIRTALSKETITDRWGDQYRAYWFVDHDDTRVIAEDSESGRLVALNYSLNGDFVEVDFASKKSVKITYVEMEGAVDEAFTLTSQERKEFDLEASKTRVTKEVESSFSQEKLELEKSKEELTTLREFKQNADKAEKVSIIEKFTELPEEAVKPFLDEIDKYSKEELETKLFAEVGKRNLSFSKKDKKKSHESIVSLTNFESSTSVAPSWFALVEEYKNKSN